MLSDKKWNLTRHSVLDKCVPDGMAIYLQTHSPAKLNEIESRDELIPPLKRTSARGSAPPYYTHFILKDWDHKSCNLAKLFLTVWRDCCSYFDVDEIKCVHHKNFLQLNALERYFPFICYVFSSTYEWNVFQREQCGITMRHFSTERCLKELDVSDNMWWIIIYIYSICKILILKSWLSTHRQFSICQCQLSSSSSSSPKVSNKKTKRSRLNQILSDNFILNILWNMNTATGF